MSVDDDEDELLEGIYEQAIPSLLDEEEKPFLPWHKPRKHYLRIHQWCKAVRDLIKELGYGSGSVVRYVGLPAADFLDVRTLHGVCEREEVQLHYLGFDSSANIGSDYEMNLSKHEVSSLGFVHPMSVVVRDRIENVAIEMSVAHNVFDRHGPFDVVNLDICDSVANATGLGSYFDAIKQVCDLQLKGGRSKPWLLFLATRVIRSQFDDVSKTKLLSCVCDNASDNPAFALEMKNSLRLDASHVRAEIDATLALSHKDLVSAFGLGFCKWLLNLAMSAAPKMKVKLLPSYSYRIEIAEPDMLSLAFKFEPIIEARKDRSGLTSDKTSKPMADTEPELALELLAGIAAIQDVDGILATDPNLAEKTIEQCGAVMATARYNKDKYMTWARETHTFGKASHPDKGRL